MTTKIQISSKVLHPGDIVRIGNQDFNVLKTSSTYLTVRSRRWYLVVWAYAALIVLGFILFVILSK